MTVPTDPVEYARECFKRAIAAHDAWAKDFKRLLQDSKPEGYGDLKGDELVAYVEWKGGQQIGMYVGPDGAPALDQQGKAQYVDMRTGERLAYTYGPNWLQALEYVDGGKEFLAAYMRQLKRRAMAQVEAYDGGH